MKTIVLLPNIKKDTNLSVSARVCEYLISRGATVYMPRSVVNDTIFGVLLYDSFPDDAELIMVIGGDGTVLDAVGDAVARDLPLLGVNLGKLGYLTEVEPTGLEALSRVLEGDFAIEERMLLTAKIQNGESVMDSGRLAFNEIVVSKSPSCGIGNFSIAVKDEGTVRYRADAVVVATPTGSTAYSLSAGGPIVASGICAMVLTPVCPHSFFDRSVVFPANEIIRIQNNGEDTLSVLSDGREIGKLAPGGVCTVSASKQKLKMLSLGKNTMFTTLFSKMKKIENI